MKNIILAFLAISAFIAAHSQETKSFNDPNAQSRQVSGFHAIKCSHGIDLYLTQSNTEAVAVSASKTDYRDRIKTVVENGVLKIYYSENWMPGWSSRKLKAYVSIKEIDQLIASGGSDVFIQGTLNSSKLELEVSGGSDFSGAVKVTDISIEASGGSDVSISGSAVNCTVSASGGSDFKGYDLITDYMNIRASGGSDARLTVNKELTAEASGGSDIDYRGNANVKRSSSSGGGSVSRRN